jgi:hypothetical protein
VSLSRMPESFSDRLSNMDHAPYDQAANRVSG